MIARSRLKPFLFVVVVVAASFASGCAVEAARKADAEMPARPVAAAAQPGAETPIASADAAKGPSIAIERNSPANTVRAFYEHLRANKLRDAIFLTNLRPAIEGLTDSELAELQLDLAPLAAQVPDRIDINGEIASGNYATVTARLPDNDTREVRLQQIKLRKEGDYWVILTVDEAVEPQIKAAGNSYFFKLRLQTHESDAKAMLERVAKAEMVYSLQNEGKFGDLPTLVRAGLLPEDALDSRSTGYNYQINVSADGKSYAAGAAPAVYGKTGQLSFMVELDASKKPKMTAADAQGASMLK